DKPLLQNMLLFGVASNIEEDPLGVSWSLDIELQFYLILPFILWLFSKINLWAIGASIALAIAGWWAFEQSGIATVFQYLPAFIIGAYIYDNQISGSLRSAIVSLIAFAALTIGIWLHPDFSRFLFKWNGTIEGTEIFSMIWMLPLIPYVAYSLTIKSSLMDRHLGNLSYPFYLVHTLVLAGATFWLSGIPRVVGALIVTFAVSSLIYVLFDQPMERLRYKYLTPRKPREVEAQPR
ncbi:MAG: acyltransferase, partial [Pseudomonadota bacterium]